MDNFQSIQSGAGLLKNSYDDSPVSQALKKRIVKIKEKTVIPTKDELEQNEKED